jgi:hypothetical protein
MSGLMIDDPVTAGVMIESEMSAAVGAFSKTL